MEVVWKTTHSARKKYQDYLKQVCKRTTTAISIFKLGESRFRLDKRKKTFTMRVVRQWDRLSGDVVDAPCLETSKVRLDKALGNLI